LIDEELRLATIRQFELHLLRFLAHPYRDDFTTVGFLLIESNAEFADMRFTRSWKMLQCLAPNMELEWFEMVESEIRQRLRSFRRREDLLELVDERFGSMISVAPTKGVTTSHPEEEMELLNLMYLMPVPAGQSDQRRVGRVAIVNTIKDAFTKAGVMELIQKDVDVKKYTAPGDPFRFDFGYEVKGVLKLFHAVSVAVNVESALAVLYRFSFLETVLGRESRVTSLTLVVDEGNASQDEKTEFAIGMMKQHRSVRVTPMDEIAQIAYEVRRDATSLRTNRSESDSQCA
jgi:hypothetical protein